LGIEEAYTQYLVKQISEEDFYEALRRFAQALVRRQVDDFTYSNIEDAISESLLEVWERLVDFDAARTSFKTFVTIIVRSNIQDALRSWKASKGHTRHIELDENLVGAAKELGAERLMLFEEWLKGLDSTDRSLVKMFQDGLTQEEIGQALKISHQDVSKRLARLREGPRPF